MIRSLCGLAVLLTPSVAGLPAAGWTLWPEAGLPVPLKALGAIGFGAHCQMQVGLRTDYRSALPMPPLEQHHYPKDGLAVNGAVAVEPHSSASGCLMTSRPRRVMS